MVKPKQTLRKQIEPTPPPPPESIAEREKVPRKEKALRVGSWALIGLGALGVVHGVAQAGADRAEDEGRPYSVGSFMEEAFPVKGRFGADFDELLRLTFINDKDGNWNAEQGLNDISGISAAAGLTALSIVEATNKHKNNKSG